MMLMVSGLAASVAGWKLRRSRRVNRWVVDRD